MGTVSCFHSFNFVSFIWSPKSNWYRFWVALFMWLSCHIECYVRWIAASIFASNTDERKKTIKSYVSKVLRWRLNATQIKKSWIHNTTRSFCQFLFPKKNKAIRYKCCALMLLPLVSLWPTVDKTNPINIWLMENVNLKQISSVQTWLWNYNLHMHLCFQLIFAGAN